MGGKITKFIDLIASFPNRFKVDGEQKNIVQDWGITQQGTKNKAEYFNEIQENLTYDCLSNRVIDGLKEVYEVDLEGYVEYGEFPLKFRAFIQTTNTTTNCYIRFLNIGGTEIFEYPIKYYNQDYILTSPEIGLFSRKQFINFKIIEVASIKYALIDLPLGYDRKLNRTGDTADDLSVTAPPVDDADVARKQELDAMAGADIKGYIEDGTPHVVGEVWLSKNVPGEFKCLIANSDNYPDLTPTAPKWLQIDDLTNASKLENLNYFFTESVADSYFNVLTFSKIGNIGIINIRNYGTAGTTPPVSYSINYPSWFNFKHDNFGSLASDVGNTAEVVCGINSLTIYGPPVPVTNLSVSGQIIGILNL